MIGLTMLGGYALVAVVAAIGSVAGAAILEGLVRLSRCRMSARTVIAQVQQPQPATPPQTPPGHPEQVRDICPGHELAYDGIVRQLLEDSELAEAIKEAGRVQ